MWGAKASQTQREAVLPYQNSSLRGRGAGEESVPAASSAGPGATFLSPAPVFTERKAAGLARGEEGQSPGLPAADK